jgi:hypothetical protein
MLYGSEARYEGKWCMNSRQGSKCNMIFADGSEYVGDFWKNKMHGHGVMRSTDGTTYQGQWEAGKRNGRGVSTPREGDASTGIWINDTLQSNASAQPV